MKLVLAIASSRESNSPARSAYIDLSAIGAESLIELAAIAHSFHRDLVHKQFTLTSRGITIDTTAARAPSFTATNLPYEAAEEDPFEILPTDFDIPKESDPAVLPTDSNRVAIFEEDIAFEAYDSTSNTWYISKMLPLELIKMIVKGEVW